RQVTSARMRAARERAAGVPVEHHDGFLLVRLRGEPYELGMQHGAALRSHIWQLWDSCERLILNARGRVYGWGFRQLLIGVARVMEYQIPPLLRRELPGLAGRSGLP